eukprot:6191324-Pleurochrysis_carterae.AAC.2
MPNCRQIVAKFSQIVVSGHRAQPHARHVRSSDAAAVAGSIRPKHVWLKMNKSSLRGWCEDASLESTPQI